MFTVPQGGQCTTKNKQDYGTTVQQIYKYCGDFDVAYFRVSYSSASRNSDKLMNSIGYILAFAIKTLAQGDNLFRKSSALRPTKNICLYYTTNLYDNQLLLVEKPFDVHSE
jgi:hypothetical protein